MASSEPESPVPLSPTTSPSPWTTEAPCPLTREISRRVCSAESSKVQSPSSTTKMTIHRLINRFLPRALTRRACQPRRGWIRGWENVQSSKKSTHLGALRSHWELALGARVGSSVFIDGADGMHPTRRACPVQPRLPVEVELPRRSCCRFRGFRLCSGWPRRFGCPCSCR